LEYGEKSRQSEEEKAQRDGTKAAIPSLSRGYRTRQTRSRRASSSRWGQKCQLQGLWVNDTPVTDAGLGHLAGPQRLDLSNTQVTYAGVATLRQTLPNYQIEGP